jgi:hypothetical protein
MIRYRIQIYFLVALFFRESLLYQVLLLIGIKGILFLR